MECRRPYIIRAPANRVEAELTPPQHFTERLIAWQKSAGRHDLPWQNTRDAYRIWLSEIMLQQTQVSTAIPYYLRFLASFPDVQALAAAPVASVLEHWAGLGYYARARNLHRCAQRIVAEHGAIFPREAAKLADLPGIGRSTAAAIAAFAYGCRGAILDGNVKRVLCRQFGIEGFPGAAAVDRKLWALAESLLPAEDIEAYTQGIMDLGATCCTRRRPACARCPVNEECVARRSGRQDDLPTAKPRASLPEREEHFVLFCDGQRFLLDRRPPTGLWGGLLVPPVGEAAFLACERGLCIRETRSLPPLRHTFSHFRLTLKPLLCLVAPSVSVQEAGREWLEIDKAAQAGVPTPIGKVIKQALGLLAARQ